MLKNITIAVALTTIISASIVCSPSATAYFGGWHPFSALAILWYGIFAGGADEDGTWVGGAQGIDQGAHDDCWFESAVAACARTENGCRLLSDMIEQSPSGGYTVTFLDQPDHPYPVTRAEITKYHVKDNALWADILEAGMIRRFPAMQNGKVGNAHIHALYGNQSVLGLKILTGHEPSLLETATTDPAVLAAAMERNIAMRIPMTAGTKSTENPKVMVPSHCYTVMAYDARSKVVTLRNPWGKNNNAKLPELPQPGQIRGGVTDIGGGVISMNMAHFVKYYRGLTYSRIFHL
jgi:hypothetical protein